MQDHALRVRVRVCVSLTLSLDCRPIVREQSFGV